MPPHRLVAGVLGYMKRDRFSGSAQDIHTAFAGLQREEPLLFTEFVFSSGENFPYSKALERALSELMHSDVIKAFGEINPGYLTYLIPVGQRRRIRRFLEQEYCRRPQLLQKLRRLARVFEASCPPTG